MRGAPQRGFARLISRISCRTSRGTLGLPGRRRDFQRQKLRNPVRCHRIIVSGRTIDIASRTVGASRYSNTKIRRSNDLKAGRLGVMRRSTFSWCRSAITSPSSERLDRKRSRRIHLSRLKISSTRRSSPDSGAQAKRMKFAVGTTPPSRTGNVRAILQRGAHAPVARKRRSPNSPGPASWQSELVPRSRRTSSPLRPNLGFRDTQGTILLSVKCMA